MKSGAYGVSIAMDEEHGGGLQVEGDVWHQVVFIVISRYENHASSISYILGQSIEPFKICHSVFVGLETFWLVSSVMEAI